LDGPEKTDFIGYDSHDNAWCDQPDRCAIEVGVTAIPPEHIVAAARLILEPAYGPMKHVQMPIENGNTLYFLLTPRFEVSPAGLDYQWVELEVCFDPVRKRSILEVNRKSRRFYPFLFSLHGGFWPIPSSLVSTYKTDEERLTLRILMRALNDPSSKITEWGKIED
jgi:hypothetical protein